MKTTQRHHVQPVFGSIAEVMVILHSASAFRARKLAFSGFFVGQLAVSDGVLDVVACAIAFWILLHQALAKDVLFCLDFWAAGMSAIVSLLAWGLTVGFFTSLPCTSAALGAFPRIVTGATIAKQTVFGRLAGSELAYRLPFLAYRTGFHLSTLNRCCPKLEGACSGRTASRGSMRKEKAPAVLRPEHLQNSTIGGQLSIIMPLARAVGG